MDISKANKISSGHHFDVYKHADHVFKIQKEHTKYTHTKLNSISRMQTYLAQYIPNINPAYHIDRIIIEPHVDGPLVRDIKDKTLYKRLRQTGAQLYQQIRDMGFSLGDGGSHNQMYDTHKDMVILIDFERIYITDERKFTPHTVKFLNDA